MDQTTARKLFKEGAIFLFLQVPEGTEFGIDMKSWNTGEKFRGVKMVPPGLHYIFYSSVNDTGDTAPRTGFFYNFKATEVVAKKWDTISEDMSMEDVTENEIVLLKDNIHALDQFLGPYPYEISQRWLSLTSHINNGLVKKLMPLSGKVKSALDLESCKDCDRPKGKKNDGPSTSKEPKRFRKSNCDELLENLLPDMKPIPGTELRFTLIPKKLYPDDASPGEITQHSLDLTYTLEKVLENYSSEMDLLGEMEFAYVCFLVGHSLEAFEQWKKIVSLLCSCENAVMKYKNLYNDFISLLELHVREIPEGFLADIVSNNNFVYVKLRTFFRTIKTVDVSDALKTKAKRFQKTLTGQYSWDFSHLDSEDEEDAPVVLDLECAVPN